jgi:hypothetical protein
VRSEAWKIQEDAQEEMMILLEAFMVMIFLYPEAHIALLQEVTTIID